MIKSQDRCTGNPSLSTGNATDSICPYGWQLPGSFADIAANVYRFSISRNYSIWNYDTGTMLTMSMIRSGYYYNSTSQSRKLDIAYWTSRIYSNSIAYSFYSTTTYSNFDYNSYSRHRDYGLSLRCLAR